MGVIERRRHQRADLELVFRLERDRARQDDIKELAAREVEVPVY
jgi:hypothetical protein